MRRVEGLLLDGRDVVLNAWLVREGVKSRQGRDAALPAGSLELAARLDAEAGRETVAVVSGRGTAPAQASAERGSGEASAAVIVADSRAAEMTTAQAAPMLGITPRAVRNLCRSGDLIARAGPAGVWLIDRASLAELAARRRETRGGC